MRRVIFMLIVLAAPPATALAQPTNPGTAPTQPAMVRVAEAEAQRHLDVEVMGLRVLSLCPTRIAV